MSSSIENTNVTTKVAFKKVTTTDTDGWSSVKKVQHESKPKSQRTKTVTETEVSAEPNETPDDNKVNVKVTTLPPAKFSGGMGYLAALRGVVDATPVKATVTVIPNAPTKNANDATSVASDSSDESSHRDTARRLSFSDAAPEATNATNGTKHYTKSSNAPVKNTDGEHKAYPKRADGEYKPRPKRVDGEYKPRPKQADGEYKPRPKYADGEYKPRPKRTDEENKSHQEYVSALRKSEDDFLRECLPSDKDRVAKVAYELEKIRNHSATVHEVSFAKDFEPVTVGGKMVAFSREKFAHNNFFINRLKKEYYTLFPSCDWVAIRESTRPDKPDSLFIRIGNRE